MDRFDSVEEVLDFAIARETEANRFYLELAGRMENKAIREVFEGFAQEETEHKASLEAIKKGAKGLAGEKVRDLAIADYTVDVEAKGEMDYQEALIIAMNKEKAAFMLYNKLAEAAEDEKVRDMFLMLAQEEARHKLRFEVEYDDMLREER